MTKHSPLLNPTISIDAMGGDHGPSVTIPASIAALAKYPELKLILVGDEARLRQALRTYTYDVQRLSIQHASQCVAMDESPLQALRVKKDSSMRVAINLVRDNIAEACVSAGNTGALMATARFVLKTLPGIDRPAIISTLPTIDPNKHLRMLDLGANVDSSAEQLVQFAVMGSVLASAMDNIPEPKVYLLNIGEEEIKGNEQVKKTAQLLMQHSYIHYAGYIEGDAIFINGADVVVCDGFVGNVVLKTSEGVVTFMTKMLRDAFKRNFFTKLLGLLVKPLFKTMTSRIDPARYNGAMLIGLEGTVIKSHGNANEAAFMNAIEQAILSAQKNIPALIRHKVLEMLKEIP